MLPWETQIQINRKRMQSGVKKCRLPAEFGILVILPEQIAGLLKRIINK